MIAILERKYINKLNEYREFIQLAGAMIALEEKVKQYSRDFAKHLEAERLVFEKKIADIESELESIQHKMKER